MGGKGKNPQVIRRKQYTTNHCLREKSYIYWKKKKKKRPTLSHQLKKINRCAIDLSKEKINTVNIAKLQGQKSALY